MQRTWADADSCIFADGNDAPDSTVPAPHSEVSENAANVKNALICFQFVGTFCYSVHFVQILFLYVLLKRLRSFTLFSRKA